MHSEGNNRMKMQLPKSEGWVDFCNDASLCWPIACCFDNLGKLIVEAVKKLTLSLLCNT